MSLRPPLSLLRAAIPVLALVVATSAGAQTTAITLDIGGQSSVTVGPADCNRTLAVNWTVAAPTGSSCEDLVVWVTKGTVCANQPATDDKTIGSSSTWVTTTTGTFTVTVSALPAFAGAVCPTDNVETVMKVCAHASAASITTGCSPAVDVKASAPPTLTFDSKPPGPPSISGVVNLDSALDVFFTAGSDASTVQVNYRSDPTATYTKGPSTTATNGTVRVENLVNGTPYELVAVAFDGANNQSAPSNLDYGTPVKSLGFFANYQNAGGSERGGCAAAPAGALPLLALGWVGRRRRQRGGGRPVTSASGARTLAAFAVLALGALATPARAQSAPGTVERPPGEIGSERTMGVEVKLGGYKPMIDEERGLAGNHPYQDTFGDSSMLMFQASGERQLFQAMGTAGVGLSAGYAERFAPAVLEDGNPAADSTGLHVVPLSLFGVYRFDYPAHAWGIPLVPYVKLGLHYSVWWSTKGSALEVTSSGGSALGGRWGWGFTGGMSLLLDVFEPRLARDFDTDSGVNHSYLFAEVHYEDVNNFYAPGLDLSGRYLMFGVAFEL